MWKEAVVAQFEKTFQNLSGRFKEHPPPSWFHGRG